MDSSPSTTSAEPRGDDLRRHRLEYFAKKQRTTKRKPGRLWRSADNAGRPPGRRVVCQQPPNMPEAGVELRDLARSPSPLRSCTPPGPGDSVAAAASSPTQVLSEPDVPPTAAGRVGKWLWDQAYAVWGWVMSVVMVALTAVTYLVAKLQSAGDAAKQAWDQYMVRSQVWHNVKLFYDHCKGEKESGQKLSEGCGDALKNGVPPPPNPPPGAVNGPLEQGSSNANRPRWSFASDMYTKAKRAVCDVEKRMYDTIDALNRDFGNVNMYTGGGSLRKRQ